MDKTALLKKVRALAEHGVGGEAENAEKLLARMMKKYGISEEELDEETRVLYSKAPYLCNTRRRRAAGNQPRGGSQNGGSHARHERRKSTPSYRGGEIKEE